MKSSEGKNQIRPENLDELGSCRLRTSKESMKFYNFRTIIVKILKGYHEVAEVDWRPKKEEH